MMLLKQLTKIQKIEEEVQTLRKENDELKAYIDASSKNILMMAKSLEEITFVQNAHLTQTEQHSIYIDGINSLLYPKNDYLKYDLTKEPYN